MNTIPRMIDINGNVPFDSGVVDVPEDEPVLMDNNISISGKFKDIWGDEPKVGFQAQYHWRCQQKI